MTSDVEVINRGLEVIGASRINSIAPPGTRSERRIAQNYESWVRSELAKRRWVFAWDEEFLPALLETVPLAKPGFAHRYELPATVVKLVRRSGDDWTRRAEGVYSDQASLKVAVVTRVATYQWDPLFVDVMAGRVALELAETVTQSNTKVNRAVDYYNEAVRVAGQANAFQIGWDIHDQDDNVFSFLSARRRGY